MSNILTRIKQIAKDKNEVSKLEDIVSWPNNDKPVSFNGFTFTFVNGYTGEEGGPKNISYIMSITNEETQEIEYYHIIGDYDSWNGTDIYLHQAHEVFLEKSEPYIVKQVRNDYKTKNGNIAYTVIENVE